MKPLKAKMDEREALLRPWYWEVVSPAPTIPHYAPNKAVGFMGRSNVHYRTNVCAGTELLSIGKTGGQQSLDGKNSAQYEHTILILTQKH